MRKIRVAALLCLLLATVLVAAASAAAATYYVATNGAEANDGSAARPWPSVEFALGKVGGGHTVIVKAGTYRGPIFIPKSCAGTEASPTVIKSETKWGAVIVGAAPYHGIANADGCDWVTVDGFEVLGARFDGIKFSGDHNVVRNCWVHNNCGMGIAAHDHNDTLIENNLIEFNGQNIQFHHGVYVSGERITIRNNIVRHNAGFGLHLYPSVKDCLVVGNLVHGHVYHAGVIVACPDGGGRNRILNNTIADNRDGIAVWNGDGEMIFNNIFTAQRQAVQLDKNTRNTKADYNLCLPAAAEQGPHGLSEDPGFMAPSRGMFWLKASSPAIGAGTAEYAPKNDFWGRPRANDAPPYVGAFPFVPELSREDALAEKAYSGWPYRFAPIPGRELPDLWTLPSPK